MTEENELLKHLDKLHTTELGIARIKRNLSLDTDQIVEWCKDKITSAGAIITRAGKNWYINVNNCCITVNSNSYTIITAHQIKNITDGGFKMSDMKAKLHTGELYFPDGEEITREQRVYQDLLFEYNQTKPSEGEKRAALLKRILGDCGDGVYIEAPFYANFGGHNCHFGKNIYVNYGLTCVDDTHIYIGDYTMLGPNVTIATAGHPILPELRQKGLQYNMPVHIGKNCWLGAGAIIMPGVTIGNNVVIGAGSVVTRDIPSDVIAVGNPCRVMRKVGEHDRKYYFKDKEINWDEWKD